MRVSARPQAFDPCIISVCLRVTSEETDRKSIGEEEEMKNIADRIWKGLRWRIRLIPGIRQIHRVINRRKRDKLLWEKIPAIYKEHSGKPVDEKKVIFAEVHGTKLSENFRLLYDDLKASGSFDIHVHYLRYFEAEGSEYRQNSCRLAEDMADAKYIFVNDACPIVGAVSMRPETIVTQMWHGCGAFKKFGESTAEKKFGESDRTRERHPVRNYDNLDYVTVSSPEVVWAYEEAMGLKGKDTKVLGIGLSRTDVFFHQEFVERARRKVREAFPASAGKKLLLYAPTFRGRVGRAVTPDYKQFDLEKLHEELGDEYSVIIKLHPFIKPARVPQIPKDLKGTFAIDATQSLTISELLCAADVCVSDYSSLIFEYSLFGKPMLFYAYDLKNYFDWRGFYYNYDQLTPGPVCDMMDMLIDELKHLDERFDPEVVSRFRDKFMKSCDGHATERIEQLVFGRTYS